jgi:GTP-binding protein
MDMLDNAAVSFQVVLTKTDKTTATMLEASCHRVGAELAGHVAAHPNLVRTSARSGIGIEELRAALAVLARPTPLG